MAGNEQRKIEFGRHYDLPLWGKVRLSAYYLLCATMAPFILTPCAVIMVVLLAVMITLSPMVMLWMLVAEIWFPPLEKNDESAQPNEPSLDSSDHGDREDPEDHEEQAGS